MGKPLDRKNNNHLVGSQCDHHMIYKVITSKLKRINRKVASKKNSRFGKIFLAKHYTGKNIQTIGTLEYPVGNARNS